MLILIRGKFSNCERNTLANMLLHVLPSAKLIQHHDFFLDDSGHVHYDPEKLGDAHEWAFALANYSLNYGGNVIVSEEFATKEQYDRYIQSGINHGHDIRVIELNVDHKMNPDYEYFPDETCDTVAKFPEYTVYCVNGFYYSKQVKEII